MPLFVRNILLTPSPAADINDTCVPDGTGLIMTANEHKNMNAYFIPELGPAPKWCHFLDTIAEELEESEQTVMYDDYKVCLSGSLGCRYTYQHMYI